MEQVIPIEECAKQRLQALVYAYSLLIKHLREEGVDREIVKRASDKVWAVLPNRHRGTSKLMTRIGYGIFITERLFVAKLKAGEEYET